MPVRQGRCPALHLQTRSPRRRSPPRAAKHACLAAEGRAVERRSPRRAAKQACLAAEGRAVRRRSPRRAAKQACLAAEGRAFGRRSPRRAGEAPLALRPKAVPVCAKHIAHVKKTTTRGFSAVFSRGQLFPSWRSHLGKRSRSEKTAEVPPPDHPSKTTGSNHHCAATTTPERLDSRGGALSETAAGSLARKPLRTRRWSSCSSRSPLTGFAADRTTTTRSARTRPEPSGRGIRRVVPVRAGAAVLVHRNRRHVRC